MTQSEIQFWLQILVYVASFAVMWGNVTTRLKVLEKKMDEHNNLQTRMAVAENTLKTLHHRVDELHEKE